MSKGVENRMEDKLGFLDFPRDVTAQTRESAYKAYNELAAKKVDFIVMNFDKSDYLNSAGIGLIISLVEDASQAGRKVFAFGLSSHYRKLFSMVGLTERIILVANEEEARSKVSPPSPKKEEAVAKKSEGEPPAKSEGGTPAKSEVATPAKSKEATEKKEPPKSDTASS